MCRPCHEQCAGGCDGFFAMACNRCKHVKSNGWCLAECNHGSYNMNGICIECHESCFPFGCTGPLEHEGIGGCNPCEKIVFRDFDRIDYYNIYIPAMARLSPCLKLNETCKTGFYLDHVPLDASGYFKKFTGRPICARCHIQCKTCTGYGFNNEVCQEFHENYKGCVCPSGSYLRENPDEMCIHCSPACKECKDFKSCLGCSDGYYRVYDGLVPRENSPHECMMECPDYQPYTLSNDLYENYCSSLNYTLLQEGW